MHKDCAIFGKIVGIFKEIQEFYDKIIRKFYMKEGKLNERF